MTALRTHHLGRLAAFCVPTLLALGAVSVAGAAIDARTGPQAAQRVTIAALTSSVTQSDTARISVNVRPVGVRCSLSVRYTDGATQVGLRPVKAVRGRAAWKWQVSATAKPGTALATITCARAGKVSRSIRIVQKIIPTRITVGKTGYSIRTTSRGGSEVSYGAILTNESPAFDARELGVLVNFVLPGGVLIGSATSRVEVIAAGSSYALGGSLSFPGTPQIERLEVVIQGGVSAAKSIRLPSIAQIRNLPGVREPSWVGSVEGEILNDTALNLDRSRLSVVIFDAAGTVIGGGDGSTIALAPPGARQFFKVTSGVTPVVFGRAASAIVSIEPKYL